MPDRYDDWEDRDVVKITKHYKDGTSNTWVKQEDKGACFIATAAYGTPFAEEINILRFWRDNFLLEHHFGNLFVKFYYKISPPIADFIRNKNLFRKGVVLILNPFVRVLKKYYKK